MAEAQIFFFLTHNDNRPGVNIPPTKKLSSINGEEKINMIKMYFYLDIHIDIVH